MCRVSWIATLLVLAMALVGCEGTTQPTASLTTRPLPTPVATATLAPTETMPPTETPLPTGTPTPEPTPMPAETPTPTATPTPEATLTPKVTLMSIGSVTGDRAGEEVTVEGTVVGTASFSAGFKFTLDDGTGQITLLMWHNVYDDCWDAPEINLGARVRAAGKVGQYEGELQIEPGFGGDVKAIEPAAVWATPREIGSLTSDDEGQRVMIEGEVIRVEGFSSAAQVFLNDGTGDALVFIWRTILDRIPDNTALGTPGSRVRVVGTVEIYKGALEVVPTLPYDVVVLETP
ncbi:MAG: OB-fold nucleic acid binding domain-containing protein [Anaerolineae bacterium]